SQIGEPAHEVEDVRQLHRAIHLRVTGEDLLDERRAGARQADDEDRRTARVAATGLPGEESRAEERADPRGAPLEVLDVEGGVTATLRVPPCIGRVCLPVPAPLLERLAQRKMKLRIARTNASGSLPIRAEPLHGGDLGVVEGIALEVREA